MADLLLHHDVFSKFGKLPSKVQKKLSDFLIKFKQDSKQASIHLEPLEPMVRDSKVRSARLGDDYRAIIIAPEQGDAYVLIHVDHHDKAYRWCENKLFETHQELGTFQIINVAEVERIAEIVKAEPKHVQVPEYRLNILTDEELYQAGTPKALIPSVRAVQSDDDFEKMAEYLPADARQILYGFVCGLDLNQAIEEMLGVNEVIKPVSPGDFSQLAQRASVDLVLIEGEEHLQKILSEDIEAWRVFLHPYQRKLVEWNVNGPMKINGAAGTGKTVALMHRSVWLAARVVNNEKVLITTYTTNLAVTIKGLIEDMSPVLSKRIDVTNLHQLARTVCQQGGWRGKIAEEHDIKTIWSKVFDELKSDSVFSQKDIMEEHEQIIDKMGIDKEGDYLAAIRTGRPRMMRQQRKLIWPYFAAFHSELKNRNLTTFEGLVHQARLVIEQGRFEKYRYVLVDELQDFGLEELKFIRAISPVGEGLSNPLCVVGDGHQRLYSQIVIPLSKAGISVQGRSRRLKINYRTTEQIRLLAQGLLDGVNVDDLDGEKVETIGDKSVFSGAEPKVVRVSTLFNATEAIVTWVKGLMADGQYKSHEICIAPGNRAVISALHSAGIETVELKARQRDLGQEEAGVRFGTKKRIKGLEFKAVAVVLNSENSTNTIDRFEDYVAVTRAREQLLLIYIEEI